ncbi:hypothetical protein [Mycobacterium sp.]|uniref:hypothetical protein n=1 Tax=Mycobacterium sp. TaxID=1785 RepID=UPI003BB0D829
MTDFLVLLAAMLPAAAASMMFERCTTHGMRRRRLALEKRPRRVSVADPGRRADSVIPVVQA